MAFDFLKKLFGLKQEKAKVVSGKTSEAVGDMYGLNVKAVTAETRNDQILDFPTSSDKQSEPAFFATPSSLLRKWLFNYIVLDSLINELQKEPLWTAGELKIFRDNCKRCLLDDTSNPREFVIVINESSGDININGRQDLHDIFDMLPTGYEMSNKDRLYRQVKLAMEEAKNRGIYNQIFIEIKK